MTHLSASPSWLPRVVAWIAGILGVAFVVFILWFAIGECIMTGSHPKFWKFPFLVQVEWIGMLMILAGCLVGIKKKAWGAGLILAGYALFHLIERKWLINIIFIPPLAVALLYLLLGWKTPKNRVT
jgi:hypothetical protein